MGYAAIDGKVWIECMPLCKTIVDFVKQTSVLPPKSDIGCYTVMDETFCDLDVRPSVLKTLGPKSDVDLPDFGDDLFLRTSGQLVEQEHSVVEVATAPGMPMDSDTPLAAGVTYSLWEALERMANLFRIYPDLSALRAEIEHPEASEASEDGGSHSLLQRSSQKRMKGMTPDQARLNSQKEEMAKAYMGLVIRAFSAKETQEHMTRWFGRDAFFNPMVRKEVLRVMNSVNHMISNVYLVYPGTYCHQISNFTMAYVFSKGGWCPDDQLTTGKYACRTRNSTNQFVFYLCPYLLTKPAETVETLVHEGSHHATAFLQDVKFENQTAYGRHACYHMALKEPLKALRNADSFCYYIQDAANDMTDSPRDRVAKSLKCPKTARSEIPNLNGDCMCAEGTACHYGGQFGCPWSHSLRLGTHNYIYFNADCPGCSCEGHATTTDMMSWDGNERDPIEKSEPNSSDPVSSELVMGQPFSSDLFWSEPVSSQPVSSEPVSTEPVSTEPVSSEPVPSQPVSNESETILHCPENSALPTADSNGDCYCSGGRHCFQWGEKGCVYSDSETKQRLSPLYFRASCSECKCLLDG